jgi:hypothetical protein
MEQLLKENKNKKNVVKDKFHKIHLDSNNSLIKIIMKIINKLIIFLLNKMIIKMKCNKVCIKHLKLKDKLVEEVNNNNKILIEVNLENKNKILMIKIMEIMIIEYLHL